MVDLVKIRKKAKKGASEGSAVVPPADPAASAPPMEEPPAPVEAGETPALRSDATTSKLDKFKQDAGKRREAEAAKTATDTAPADQVELLTFVIAGEQYAVDIERIVEIVTPKPLTRIPNADPSIVGIISLRGTIVTLVDVRGKLRHPPAGEATPDTRIVVIDFHSEMVGFVVDRVLRVVKTAAADIESHPVVHATELDEAIRGVFRAGGALTILLDLDKLLGQQALAAR